VFQELPHQPGCIHFEKGCQQQQTASLGGKDLQQKLKWDLHACPFEGAQETAEKDSKKSPKKKHSASAVKVVLHSKKKAPAKGPKGAH
jgi:hypothetical protein